MSEDAPPTDDTLPLDPDIEAPSAGQPSRPTLTHAAAVFAGGCIGSVGRYAVMIHTHPSVHAFPWTIVTINMVGAFALGVLGGSLFTTRPDAVTLRLFLGAGVLGGWTTYSGIVVGLLTFAHFGSWGLFAINMVAAGLLPFAGAGIGLVIGSTLARTGRV